MTKTRYALLRFSLPGKSVGAAVRTACLAVCFYAGAAQATICVYENGEKRLYTNVSPGAGWRKVECIVSAEPPPVAKKSSGSSSPVRNSSLPRITSEKQKERDAMRRKVLEDELATEARLLTDSRTAYADGAPAALPEEFLNPQKYSERLARLRETLELHERNVEALKKEIARM